MKRILIVDDEQCVLSGLRRQLHARRSEWELLFLDGGAPALAELAARPADVLVTDMRMPGMDGAQLLARVATEHPRVARLVLSGQAEAERQLVARGCCHGYLTKPCPAEALEAAIRQALAVREALDALAWQQGARLWDSSPMEDAPTEHLFRHLAGDHNAEACDAAVLELLDSDGRLVRCLAALLAHETSASLVAECGAPPLLALALAIRLRERVGGADDCQQALAAAAQALAGVQALGFGPEPAVQAAAAELLDLPGPPRPCPGRRAVLEYLLPVWGFPEAVVAAAAQAPARTPDAPHLIPAARR